jgi:hypothetical protein
MNKKNFWLLSLLFIAGLVNCETFEEFCKNNPTLATTYNAAQKKYEETPAYQDVIAKRKICSECDKNKQNHFDKCFEYGPAVAFARFCFNEDCLAVKAMESKCLDLKTEAALLEKRVERTAPEYREVIREWTKLHNLYKSAKK